MINKELLSEHFSMNEVIFSSTAIRKDIDNSINKIEQKDIYDNILDSLENISEPIRNFYATPFSFNSFYRCSELNEAVGGSRTSDHCFGRAQDIEVPGVHNIDLGIFCYINLSFKQLIFEFVEEDRNKERSGWIHISYDKNNNKGEVKFAKKENGRTIYIKKSDEEMKEFITSWENNV